MFGRSFFGARMFGPRFWGVGAAASAPAAGHLVLQTAAGFLVLRTAP